MGDEFLSISNKSSVENNQAIAETSNNSNNKNSNNDHDNHHRRIQSSIESNNSNKKSDLVNQNHNNSQTHGQAQAQILKLATVPIALIAKDSNQTKSIIAADAKTNVCDVPRLYLFIDRDGTHFRHVLNYLRDENLILPNDKTLYQELLVEAQYYQLLDLEILIKNQLATLQMELAQSSPLTSATAAVIDCALAPLFASTRSSPTPLSSNRSHHSSTSSQYRNIIEDNQGLTKLSAVNQIPDIEDLKDLKVFRRTPISYDTGSNTNNNNINNIDNTNNNNNVISNKNQIIGNTNGTAINSNNHQELFIDTSNCKACIFQPCLCQSILLNSQMQTALVNAAAITKSKNHSPITISIPSPTLVMPPVSLNSSPTAVSTSDSAVLKKSASSNYINATNINSSPAASSSSLSKAQPSPSSNLLLNPSPGSRDTNPEKNVFTWDEIKKHNGDNDCWVVVKDQVFDVTKFIPKHPAGLQAIAGHGGTDVSKQFAHHSALAQRMFKRHQIGRLFTSDLTKSSSNSNSNKSSNTKEASTSSCALM